MSDTPETDASCGYALSSHYGRLEGSYLQMDWSGPFVHAEVARKLERDRDEAREKAERYRIEANAMMMQRDEAREELEEYRSIAENIGAKKAVSEKEKAIKERDEWKNKAYSHATDYTLMEAKCFRLEQQLKEYDKLKS